MFPVQYLLCTITAYLLLGLNLSCLLIDILSLHSRDCEYLFISISGPLTTLLLSPSLGMKDSWGPLKALAVASAINGIGDIILCIFLGYGIAGAAWATMVSQVLNEHLKTRHASKFPINIHINCY